MLQERKYSVSQKVISILIGGLLLGMLWRARGTGGWGSSWGLLNAGFIFSMFIALIKGERQKMSFGWLGLTALSFMLTVPSWGTLLNQITGVLHKPEIWQEGDPMVYVSIPSAVFLMLCLGFGLATLFGIMLGRGYSAKQWNLKDFVIVLVVFYAVDLISKASVSHYILDFIQPQATEIFQAGLLDEGMDIAPHKAFLQHFNDLSWAKKIEGGRNYFSSIQTISSLLRSVAAILAVRFIVKDKVSAKMGLIVSIAFSFSITVSNLFFYFGNGGYHMQGKSPFPPTVEVWSCWEYFTGFIAGVIITAFALKFKEQEDVAEAAFLKIPEKVNSLITFILTFIGMVGINIVRPVLERFKDGDYQLVATGIALVITIILVVLINKKYGFNCKKISANQLYSIIFPLFVFYVLIAYLFIAMPDGQEIREISKLHTVLFVLSSLSTLAWCGFKKRIDN